MFNIVPAIAILCRSGCLGHNQQPTWQHTTLNLFMSKTKLHLVTHKHSRTYSIMEIYSRQASAALPASTTNPSANPKQPSTHIRQLPESFNYEAARFFIKF